MLRALVRIILVIVVIVAAAAFLIGYRWGVPHRSATTQPTARQESPVATAGDRADTTRERARATGAEIGEKVAAGAAKASETLDEARLTAKVKSKIALDDTLNGSHVDVTTDDHRVTLTGTVINEAQHRRALDLARETTDVSNVVDHLSVGDTKAR
jgi:uncharacterized FlaG/YvyC family protein